MLSNRYKDLEAVRQLWADRFQGVLSTQPLAEPCHPLGSVIPYCLDRTDLPIFLLSHLAQHSKNLDAARRCAFTFAEPATGDVQQSLRLTYVADCAPASPQDANAAQRYFRYFPQGLNYFEDLNFKLYRSVPRRFHYNGGFATARWLGTDRLLRPSTIDQATESQLIANVDQTDPQRLSNLAGAMPGEAPPRVAGIDPYGLDLAIGERLKRIPFPQRIDTPEDLDGYLRRIP